MYKWTSQFSKWLLKYITQWKQKPLVTEDLGQQVNQERDPDLPSKVKWNEEKQKERHL